MVVPAVSVTNDFSSWLGCFLVASNPWSVTGLQALGMNARSSKYVI